MKTKILALFLFLSFLPSLSYLLWARVGVDEHSLTRISEVEGIPTVININALRMLDSINGQPLENGSICYVVGYYHSVDRGGGHFMYDTNIEDRKEDGGIHIKSNVLPGIWRRINYERITVDMFGALRGDELDDTDAIQSAIDYAAKNSPQGAIHFLNGTYYVQEIILRKGVSLLGEFGGTIIKPFPDMNGLYKESLVRLDSGFVEHVVMDGFLFYGDILIDGKKVSAPMHCFNFDADTTDGGIWYSSIKNVVVRQFAFDGIRLIGGTDFEANNIYQRVNQFLTFENVRVFRPSSEESIALYMFGQNGQINFVNCNFSGRNRADRIGTSVWLESTNQNPLNPMGGRGPQTSLINFDTCTFEHSDNAFTIKGGYSINIHRSWFEGLNKCIAVLDFSKGVSISYNIFSNADTDYLLLLDSDSIISLTNNVIRQAKKPTLINEGRRRNIMGNNNYWEVPGLPTVTIFKN